MNACILVVDDDPEIVGAIAITLEREGYRVLRAYDGMEALDLALDPAVRLILIDVMMPKLDGLSALLRIREKRNLPVIVLSAKSEDTDKILGLSMGADDYVTKPFSLAVLRARVNNLLRRAHSHSAVLELPPFTFDFQKMAYTRNGVPLELSRTEQRLLRLLAEHRGQTLSRARLLEQVWDGGEFVDENALSVAVKRLRSKLTDAPIRTIYGVGYVWAVEP